MRTNSHEWGRADRQSRAASLLECGSLTPAFQREGGISRVARNHAQGQPKRNSKFRTPNHSSASVSIPSTGGVAGGRGGLGVHPWFNSSGNGDEIETASTAPGGPPPHVTLPPQARVPGQPGAGPGAGIQEEPPATGGTITYHDFFTPEGRTAEVRREEGESQIVEHQYIWSFPGPDYPDALVLRDDITPQRRLYAQQDALGSVTSLVDSFGDTEERYAYDPYGNRSIFDPDYIPRTSSFFEWRRGDKAQEEIFEGVLAVPGVATLPATWVVTPGGAAAGGYLSYENLSD